MDVFVFLSINNRGGHCKEPASVVAIFASGQGGRFCCRRLTEAKSSRRTECTPLEIYYDRLQKYVLQWCKMRQCQTPTYYVSPHRPPLCVWPLSTLPGGITSSCSCLSHPLWFARSANAPCWHLCNQRLSGQRTIDLHIHPLSSSLLSYGRITYVYPRTWPCSRWDDEETPQNF
jgi:hypothetical protein